MPDATRGTVTPLGRFVDAMTGGETAIKMDGYDDCVLGIAFRCTNDPVLVYDCDAVRDRLMTGSEMTYEEAEEWIEFNMTGAWVGEQTPFLLRRFDPSVWQEVPSDPASEPASDPASDPAGA